MAQHESVWLKEAFTTPAGGSRWPVTENLLHVDFSMMPRDARAVLVVSGGSWRHLGNMLAKASLYFDQATLDVLLLPRHESPKGFSGVVHSLATLPIDHEANNVVVEALTGRYDVFIFAATCNIEAVHILRGPSCHSDIMTFASRIRAGHVFAMDNGYNVRRMTPHLRLIEPIDVGGKRIYGLGATFPDELQLFYRQAKAASNGTVVEIGSFNGKSTAVFASAMDSGHVVSVDINHRDMFFETLERNGVADKVETITMDSSLANEVFRKKYPDTLIDVLYIDGSHDRDVFMKDVIKWTPLLKPGGMLMCHDYLWCSDIIEVVFEKIVCGGEFEQFGTIDYTFYSNKKAEF